jgi:hypothetical protein
VAELDACKKMDSAIKALGACKMHHLPMRIVWLGHILLLLTSAGQTVAFAQSRWVEFDYDDRTITYDLTTVQLLDPGRFTIISNSQDHPDVIRLELAVLATLKSYCSKPDGEYAPPPELFTLGNPDMPIEKIQVKTQPGRKPFKNAVWYLPYRRLALNYPNGPQEKTSFFDCEGPAVDSINKEYDGLKSYIMNGIASKELYDCRHGIMGLFLNADDPPSKAITGTNIKGAYLAAYLRLCVAIVGSLPYMPNDASER